MSRRKMQFGSTNLELPILVQDTTSSTGGGLAGLLFNTAGLVAEYRRQNASTWTPITLVTATLGTYTSSGFCVDGALAGAYVVGVPNAALVSGSRFAYVRLYGAANMAPVLAEIELDAVNYQDAVSFGLSALPAVAAGAAGGLPLGDAFARIGALGAGLTALGDTRLANLDAPISTRNATTPPTVSAIRTEMDTNSTKLLNLDATTSSRMAAASYVAPSTAPTAAAIRAEIDTNSTKLDAAISTRSTYAGGDTAGVTTLLTRVPSVFTFTGTNVNSAAQNLPSDYQQRAIAVTLPAAPAGYGASVSGGLSSSQQTQLNKIETALTPLAPVVVPVTVIVAPTNAVKCRVVGFFQSQVQISFQLLPIGTPSRAGEITSRPAFTVESDANGVFDYEVIRNDSIHPSGTTQWSITCPKAFLTTTVTLNGPTFDLSTLIPA